jgi:hypothetical protein
MVEEARVFDAGELLLCKSLFYVPLNHLTRILVYGPVSYILRT